MVGKVFWDPAGRDSGGPPTSRIRSRSWSGAGSSRSARGRRWRARSSMRSSMPSSATSPMPAVDRPAGDGARGRGDWLGTLSPASGGAGRAHRLPLRHALAMAPTSAWPAGSDGAAGHPSAGDEGLPDRRCHARKRYDLARATELHERAVGLAVTPLERAVALEELGDVHDAAYDGDPASWRGTSPSRSGGRFPTAARRSPGSA